MKEVHFIHDDDYVGIKAETFLNRMKSMNEKSGIYNNVKLRAIYPTRGNQMEMRPLTLSEIIKEFFNTEMKPYIQIIQNPTEENIFKIRVKETGTEKTLHEVEVKKDGLCYEFNRVFWMYFPREESIMAKPKPEYPDSSIPHTDYQNQKTRDKSTQDIPKPAYSNSPDPQFRPEENPLNEPPGFIGPNPGDLGNCSGSARQKFSILLINNKELHFLESFCPHTGKPITVLDKAEAKTYSDYEEADLAIDNINGSGDLDFVSIIKN